MSYLKHKPGSIEELMANEASKLNDNAYQDMFKKELDKAGKGIGSMSPKEKKDFFNKIDSKYKAKNEAKVDELTKAQEKLPPALQKAIKDKEQKEDLDNKDKSVVKDVVSALKKATKAHSGQAKDLEKAMKTESASQVQVKRDGKGNFNLMFRGKEIGYYHKSGSKMMVYYDKDGDDYNQSDEVSSEMQAKKLAYDNMNEVKEADQHADEINQKKIDKVKADKKVADSGSKMTKVETEPKVDYKN